VITKPRVNHSRTHILFFFALIFIQQACKSGEVDITVLYTAKTPLNWPESTYGYLLAVDYACLGISSAIVLPCLVRFFGLTDMTLCIIGISFKIIRLAMIAYGRYTWLVFLSVVIGSPSALIISSAKSMISKSVGEDEMGKTFSLLSCGETIANLVGSLTFTGLYAATVNIYPGLTFAADAGLMVILLFTILLLTYDIRRTNRNLSVTSPYASLEDSNLNGNNLLIGSAAQLTSDDVCSSYGAVEQTNNGGHFTDVNNPVGDTCTEDKLKKQLTSSDDESRHNAGNT
jgi:MFS-type transporter involved in bile tolerance (Atg22 family)